MNTQSISRLALVASSALSLTFAANPALAQSAPSGASDTGGLTEIVVTAQRKSESLISVPVAVTAVNSEVLQRANVTSIESAAAIVPFVTITRVGAGNGGFMSIRGIGSTPVDAGAQQSVLSNIDYVLIGRGRLATMAMFDIGQVEVLKGPQALYYGKNTTAGVFSITSNDPGRTFGGYVKAGYEFEAHQRYLDAAVDVPLGETLRARVAGHYSKMRGYVRNTALPTAYPVGSAYQPWINAGITTAPGAYAPWGPNDEEIGGRLTLVYEPSSDFTAKLKYTYAHTGNKGLGGTALYQPYCFNATNISQVFAPAAGVVDPYSDCNRDQVMSSGALPQGLTKNAGLYRDGVQYAFANGQLASLNIDYQIADNLKLSAITGYYNVIYQGTGNYSQSVWAGVFAATRDTAWGLSQELRLESDFDSPVNFEIGAFVDRLHQDTNGQSIVAPHAADPVTGQFVTYARTTDSTSRSYSVFGKVKWDIVKNLTLSGGVRFTRYLLDSTDGNAFVNTFAPAALNLRAANSPFVRTYKDRNYSPEVVLSWKPADRQTLFVSFKTGYKSGGFSYPSVLSKIYTIPNTTFKPEEAYSWEAGYKAELFDRRLRVELAAYRTTVVNQQLSAFDAPNFAFFVSNAGKSRVQGVELQLTAAPVEGLQVFSSVGYNDGVYVSYPGAQCSQTQRLTASCPAAGQDLTGRRLPRAPKWAGNFGGSYDMPLGSGLKLSVNGMGTFSAAYYSIDSDDPKSIQPSYIKWDAGIAIGAEDDKWRLSLQGRNLSNKYINQFAYDAARAGAYTYVAVPQRGRQVSLDASYRF